MKMDKSIQLALASNLKLLMEYHGHNQSTLARKSKIPQTTISSILRIETTKRGCTLGNLDAIAKIYGLEAWHLLIPDQPIEVLLSKSIEKLVENYNYVSTESRNNISRITENEVRYIFKQKEQKK